MKMRVVEVNPNDKKRDEKRVREAKKQFDSIYMNVNRKEMSK